MRIELGDHYDSGDTSDTGSLDPNRYRYYDVWRYYTKTKVRTRVEIRDGIMLISTAGYDLHSGDRFNLESPDTLSGFVLLMALGFNPFWQE